MRIMIKCQNIHSFLQELLLFEKNFHEDKQESFIFVTVFVDLTNQILKSLKFFNCDSQLAFPLAQCNKLGFL